MSALSVYFGSNKLSTGGTKRQVKEAIIHEDYDPMTIKNDVGMIKVDAIDFTEKIQPVVLDEEYVEGNKSCILSGWGVKDNKIPDDLQHLKSTTMSFEDCKKAHFVEVGVNEICTINPVGEGGCSSDSGGPLVKEIDDIKKQIGIVSWGIPCGKGYPDVYARVSSYVTWFKDTCDNCI